MRSEPDSMVVAATAGEATKLFVRDSRTDPTFAGNEDEVEFGLHNYLGLAVHDQSGKVVGTVCVLDDTALG
jgi:hypothetical protein